MTKKPTGLTLTRDDNKFTRKWKRGASYNKGQQVGRRINAGTWSNTDVGSSVTSKAFDIDFTKYYPNTQTLINSVSFRVRGKKGSSWSAYATKTMTLQLTNEPVLTVTPDTSIANRCVFSWETETSNSGDKIFTDCEWQSILVPNCNVVDGEQLAWSGDNFTNGVGKATDSVTKDETIEISTGTHTRWFRVRSRGPRGNSNWVYGKRVYASPYQMVIQETSATKTDNGYQVYVKWSGNSNDAYPTDTLTIDYTMATPDPGMVCPAGASPTTAVTVAQQGETNAVSFAIDSYLGRDQALYARVNSVHNLTTTYGDWTLVSVGELSQPTLSGVTTDPTTHRATVTATNNSAVTDSFLAIVYRTASAPDDFAVLGVIPYGQTSATVQCPNWTGQTIQFGVYAVVGSYNATTRADGVGSYEISVIMKSGTVWQAGSMPDAPNEISVTATSVQGSVKVSWNWSWADANEAVISWADHEDAWESTSEPNEYTVSNVHASEWTIAGLETGKRWYIRVRLINTTADSAIYGPWSDMAVIDLSSAPSIPTLTLSSGIIPVDGSVSAYWSYVATDGTAQAYASVCEAFITNGGIIYGEPIAHVETAQHVTIYAEEQGWNEGETHYLCVSVVSASGRVSDEWSDPVPVTIAEPLECTIAQTSLENETIETNPREFSGDLVSFETEMEEDFTKLEVALSPIQNLHEYEYPWVGGAGKNLYDASAQTTTASLSDETFTMSWTNGAIQITGKNKQTFPAGTYTIKFTGDSELSKVNVGIYFASTDATFDYFYGMNIAKTFTISDEFYIGIFGDYLIPGTSTFKVQLEKGSTATEWSPYENICPITAPTTSKNLLPYPYEDTRTSIAGVEIANNGDGTLTFNGTTDATLYYNLGSTNMNEILLPVGAYTVSIEGVPNNNDIRLVVVKNGTWFVNTSAGVANFTLTESANIYCYLIANSGRTFENLTIKPQLEIDTSGVGYSTPTAYQPYGENIQVNRQGKNLLRPIPRSGSQSGISYTIHDDGRITINGTANGIVYLNYDWVNNSNHPNDMTKYVGETMYASITPNLGSRAGFDGTVYTKTGDVRTLGSNIGDGRTINVIDGDAWGRFYIVIYENSTFDNETFYPMMCYDSETDKTWEPYQEQSYVTDTEVQVFEGILDLVSGLLTVDEVGQTINGGVSLYGNYGVDNKPLFYFDLTTAIVPYASKNAPLSAKPISNKYSAINTYAVAEMENGQFRTKDTEEPTTTRIYIRDDRFTTASQINADLATTPLTIIGKLVEPQTYQLTPQQINTLIGQNNVWSEDGELNIRIAESARDILALKEMPLTVTVTGAGEGGTTMLVIERAEDYHIDRPDNTDFNGYEGETIYSGVQAGESEIMINREDLIGSLDDGASYRLVATVQDGLGQADTKILEFEVDWAHQAIEPSGSVNMQDVALITPTKPNGWLAGDTVDIYRLSADRPELIVEGGEFGTVYVDPYPTIGQFGGYRLVYKTYDGDYITEDNNIAWLDIMAPLDVDYSIINFNGEELHLRLNLEITNQWQKNFKETKYLGGSVQGDWDKGYSRNGTLKGLVVFDPDTILQTKELAVWDGICHLRTPDGASFACNIEVSDDISYNSAGKAYAASLNITRVDSEELDGQEYSVWEYEEA